MKEPRTYVLTGAQKTLLSLIHLKLDWSVCCYDSETRIRNIMANTIKYNSYSESDRKWLNDIRGIYLFQFYPKRWKAESVSI